MAFPFAPSKHITISSTALTDSARSALFRTVLAVLAVFACMTGIGTRAGRGRKTFRPSKCGEHNDRGQKEGREGPFMNHRAFSSDAVSCTSDPDCTVISLVHSFHPAIL